MHLVCTVPEPRKNVRVEGAVIDVVVLPRSGSEPILDLNRTRNEPKYGFGQWLRTGPNLMFGLGFEDYAFFRTCANMFEPVRTSTFFSSNNESFRGIYRVLGVITALDASSTPRQSHCNTAAVALCQMGSSFRSPGNF
jgi:hypothetical protein